MGADFFDCFLHAGDELEALDIGAHEPCAAGDDGWHASFGDVELGNDLFEGEVAEFGDFVLFDLADSVVRGEFVKDAAGFAKGIGYGAIEIKDQNPVFHTQEIWSWILFPARRNVLECGLCVRV